MEQNKICWKVVYSKEGRLSSAIVCDSLANFPLEVEYVPREIVDSPYGPILAFEQLEYADDFLGGVTGLETWKAEAYGRIEKVRYVLTSTRDRLSVIDFWQTDIYRSSYKDDSLFSEAPEGTIRCDAIRLLEKVRPT